MVQKLQGQLDELLRLVEDVPFWTNTHVSLEELARTTEALDFYRWLGYLSLLLFDVLICLLVLFGLIRNSRGTLIGVCLLGVLTLVISWGTLGLELAAAASVLLLGATALLCLALDLLFLLFYSFWLCCRRRKSHDSAHSHGGSQPSADCCCTAWCVIIATLVCSAGIAVGFYGNGESSDGATRLAYSLRHANRTVSGINKLVTDNGLALNQTVGESLEQLSVAFQEQPEHVSMVQKLQGQLDELLRLVEDVPFWTNTHVSLEELARTTEALDFYRWLGYLSLLLFDVLICLLVLFGLIRNSRGTLIGVIPQAWAIRERGNDDAPGCAAAVSTGLGASVGVGRVMALPTATAQPEGVEEQEEQVQGQAQESSGSQEQHRLWRTGR
uniref:Protein tweety homolog n=1 Tax=Knipowitschia caucasica TaxID=637954 RepID=A0AAV2LH62_KNICA